MKNRKEKGNGPREYWWQNFGLSDDTYNVVGTIDGRNRVGTKSQDKKAQQEVSELQGCR